MGDCKLDYYVSKYGIYIIIILFLIIVYYYKKYKAVNDIKDETFNNFRTLNKQNEELKILLNKTQSERDEYINLYQKSRISADDCNAVSYTHLDVYKRQLCYCIVFAAHFILKFKFYSIVSC